MEIENLRQKKGLLQHIHMLTYAYIHYTYVSAMVFCFKNCSDLLWGKKCSCDQEKLLKFEAQGRKFAKYLRSLEQFQKVKGQNNFWQNVFLTWYKRFLKQIRTIIIGIYKPTGKVRKCSL